MDLTPTNDAVPERLLDLLDERIFHFAQHAQRHFKTNDLVVMLDFREDPVELEALPREGLAGADELPLDIRLKLAKPASELQEELGSAAQSFWFIVIYEDEDSDCAAVDVGMLPADGA